MTSMGVAFLYKKGFGVGCFSIIENLPGRRFSMGEALLYDTGTRPHCHLTTRSLISLFIPNICV